MSLKDEKQFIFVGRPAMTGKGDEIRSKFIQEVKRKYRLQRRNNAVEEINKLLKEDNCRMSLSYGNRSTSAISKPCPEDP
jgi:hypothetical protein